MTLQHEGDNMREFYSSLPRPVRVGIEATGSMQWNRMPGWSFGTDSGSRATKAET
jgi:hypothetical protein